MGVNGELSLGAACSLYKVSVLGLSPTAVFFLNPIGQHLYICNLTLTKPQPNPDLTNQIRALKCVVVL